MCATVYVTATFFLLMTRKKVYFDTSLYSCCNRKTQASLFNNDFCTLYCNRNLISFKWGF